ncbi:MAG TPA: bifunctional 4-hydroxy-2-oxoglutarate aldolase/2-dehydro-3-deoxy-phosphogluconate aldolase [Chitinophagaceae bacterium]|jgi:2-dehydro-3-deoxyphosphogluconate aldolase / (4S)-4-hydroxy-2-oxoglutarate aldolase|nr:bifunctional 4-hydroxy-2-oxoglutarate aldolase/2-dehydro-3-deoxy-phosphogluconate aldolase [Chitinophagaceae bacterium]
MYKKEKIIQAIIQQGVLPLYFHPDENTGIGVMESLYAAGIRVIEYTNRGKPAMKNFRSLKKICSKQFPDLILGLGTVLDTKAALKAIDLGADFLVSPGYSRELALLTADEKKLWIPGCMTPSELMQVQASGPGLVKIFPANIVGPAFIHAVREIFPDLFFMPTGGVDGENLEAWFKAGVSAVGMGNSLISRSIMGKKDYSLLKSNTSTLLKQIAAIRASLV